MIFSVAHQSNQGGRDYNEDRTSVFRRGSALLLIVADGLGGHEAGDLASQTFIDTMAASFSMASDEQLKDSNTFFSLSINYAHHMIHRRAKAQGLPASGPKTTCVVCLIFDGQVCWAHSGDSRLYHINKHQIIETTKDHVSHRLSPSGHSPLNRCVGGAEAPKPEITKPKKINKGDVLALATDGAWANFDTEVLAEFVDPNHPTLGLDNMLLELEKRNKAPSDNLSMVLLYWGVKQRDIPNIVQLRQSNKPLPNKRNIKSANAEPFDMAQLDEKIGEIENFISDVDRKI